ncbi:hypothetical protein AH4AK4_1597 [Aeromonas hydrophila 4AK4]|nr:hypothetical protein AH4AK4_1597 [Aeromonas hydrophila 4AK4]
MIGSENEHEGVACEHGAAQDGAIIGILGPQKQRAGMMPARRYHQGA